MKKEEKTTKVSKKLGIIIAALSAVLLALIVLVVCLCTKEETTEEQNPAQVGISTPYCQLKYPSQWEGHMAVEESTNTENTAYMFYAVIGEERYALYTIYFGTSAPGNLFGYLPSDGGAIPVYVDCHDVPDRNAMSESELAQLLSMMEGVNEVTQSIAATPGYEAPL